MPSANDPSNDIDSNHSEPAADTAHEDYGYDDGLVHSHDWAASAER